MNKSNKKISAGKLIGIIFCVVVVGAFLYSTLFSNTFTMDEAIAIAKSYAPKNTVLVETEEERKAYDITFASEDLFTFHSSQDIGSTEVSVDS